MLPKVSIIIVNYNGFEETIGCLKSLLKLDYSNFNVFVVENGSSNDSLQRISDFLEKLETQDSRPVTQIIKSTKNLGFAGGCNLGIREAQKMGADYFLLLNPDTKVEKDFLSKLIEVSENSQNYSELKAKKIGFLGSRIFYEDKKTIYSNGGYIKCNLLQAELRDHGKLKENLGKTKPFLTDYITGTALLVSKSVLNEIGLMREDYFLYYEDSDWAVRAFKKGFVHVIVPDSVIYHKGYHSTEYLSFNYIYYLVRNGYYLAWWNGNFFQKTFAVFYSIYKLFKQFPKIFIPEKRKWINPIFKATWDFWRKKTGKINFKSEARNPKFETNSNI
ncbi:MAG: glycosyltransferase family 2 protein [Candidatus Paceibacterota bacterium]|jgi:hypothetical protein